MDADHVLMLVQIKCQELILLPVFQGTHHVLLRIVKNIRNIRDTGSAAGAHHTEQIQIDLKLRIIGSLHVFVDKPIGNNCRIGMVILINCETTHYYTTFALPLKHNMCQKDTSGIIA